MNPYANSREVIRIIGGGPAGMMAAIELSKTHEVHLYEKGKTLGRKFLVAGKGGFNLSNQTTGKDLYDQYDPSHLFSVLLQQFDTHKTREFLAKLGIPTYIGSSGRVFPEAGIKPIHVLNAFKNRLIAQGVQLYFEHEFVDFDAKKISFQTSLGTHVAFFDRCVFALGGASWSVTGSKGDWLKIFQQKGIYTTPFAPSNCGLHVSGLNPELIAQFEGSPLKNIAIRCEHKIVKGEAVLTNYGLEGNAVYPIAAIARKELETHKKTAVFLDFKPFNTQDELLQKISPQTRTKNYSYLFKLSKVQLGILKNFTDKETYTTPALFVEKLKNLEIPIIGLRPIEEAISTVGGISRDSVNSDLTLKKIPNIYVAGEMFDWDTITGGYLLQGCFATAHAVARSILNS
jgi:uncharacterized flavoprotein (TIGR03862 family)